VERTVGRRAAQTARVSGGELAIVVAVVGILAASAIALGVRTLL
jgi:hypothetical protein